MVSSFFAHDRVHRQHTGANMRLKEEVSPILEEMLACDSAELAFEMESPAEYGNEELIFKGDRFRFRHGSQIATGTCFPDCLSFWMWFRKGSFLRKTTDQRLAHSCGSKRTCL